MSDTKNHKLAIKAIIEAHRTPGKMREIMLQVLADKPSAIVNAWEEVKPVGGKSRKSGDSDTDKIITCGGCCFVFKANGRTTECPECGRKI